MSRSAMSITGSPASSASSRATLPALSPWRASHITSGQVCSVLTGDFYPRPAAGNYAIAMGLIGLPAAPVTSRGATTSSDS